MVLTAPMVEALILNTVKIAMLASIIILFILKPMAVSFYQQRSGDYFSNRLIDWYSNGEIYNSGITAARKKIMVLSNRLNTALWILAFLLMAVIILEKNM